AGVYHESVLVHTNGIAILGSGASKGGTVLEPPKAPQKRCLHGASGFCVFGHMGSNGPVPVRNVRISGFLIRGFAAFGVVTFGSDPAPRLRPVPEPGVSQRPRL